MLISSLPFNSFPFYLQLFSPSLCPSFIDHLQFCKPTNHVSNSGTWYLPHPWPKMFFKGPAAWLTHFLRTHLSPLTEAFTNDPVKNRHTILLTLSQFSQHLSSSDILSNYPLILFSISHDKSLNSRASRSLFNLLWVCLGFFSRG